MQRIVYPVSIFDANIGVSDANNTDVVRWTFTGQGFLSIGVLCCLSKYLESNKLKYLYFTIILLCYFLLQGSRSLMFAIVIAIIYFMFKKGLFKFSIKNLFKLVFFCCFFIYIIKCSSGKKYN